jgi:hypothetical protein
VVVLALIVLCLAATLAGSVYALFPTSAVISSAFMVLDLCSPWLILLKCERLSRGRRYLSLGTVCVTLIAAGLFGILFTEHYDDPLVLAAVVLYAVAVSFAYLVFLHFFQPRE